MSALKNKPLNVGNKLRHYEKMDVASYLVCNVDHVEFETLDWVDWFNNRRLLEPIGNIPPAECEVLYYQSQEAPVMVAGLT